MNSMGNTVKNERNNGNGNANDIEKETVNDLKLRDSFEAHLGTAVLNADLYLG